jgi:hypothetical protein
MSNHFDDRYTRVLVPKMTRAAHGASAPAAVIPSQALDDPSLNDTASAYGFPRPVWIDPPISWENIDQIAYTLLPAIGSTAVIISFKVPIGRNGVIQKVANNFVGGGWTEGTGDVIWRILIDGAPPPGAMSYDAIPASLGSPANPVGIPGFRIFENQLLTVVGFNNPAGPGGGIVVAGQRLGARIIGFLYPRELEPGTTWI